MFEMSAKLKKMFIMIVKALVIYILLVIFEHSGLAENITGNRVYMFLLYLIPYYIVGGSVLKKAIIGMKNKQMFDESFLMAIATIGAFATGENAEAVAVMLFYQIGEWFQQYAVGKSRKNISDLMDIAPEIANIEQEDGSVEECDPYDVEIGDMIVVKPGEKIPVDGIVVAGASLVNTSALTGESVPRSVSVGDEIISGCVNGDQLLRIKATKVYEDSTVAKILDLVENASSKKSKTENFITRFARVYTPVVVFSALALALIPPIFVGHWSEWIYRACTFLVISCPCALVISVPLAFFGGIGAASREGVLVKGSNYLELMSHLDTVVSDKTGTLTKGVFKVNQVISDQKEELLRLAALAEGLSTHPIAQSIQQAHGQPINQKLITHSQNIAGQGIIANIENSQVLVGNALLMKNNQIDYQEVEKATSTIVYVAKDHQFLGTILISDEIKPEAKKAIEEMKKAGIHHVVMLTGDKESVAHSVSDQLQLDGYYAELLPGDKVTKVEELLKNSDDKHKLAFIGDGINDAPVLARADVGIAMGSLGSDAAIEAADIVIMDDDLRRLPSIIRIARKTISISNQNIVFSLVVKIGTLILGAVGIANMWMAVFADVGVAVLAILNSMRTLRTK